MRWRRLLLVTLGGVLLYNLGLVWTLFQLPEAVAAHLNNLRNAQIVIGVTWVALCAWSMIALIKGRPTATKRAAWVLLGFIAYTTLVVVVFSRADYDRQRTPFLLVCIGVALSMFLIARRLLTVSDDENKEKFSDDGQRKDSRTSGKT